MSNSNSVSMNSELENYVFEYIKCIPFDSIEREKDNLDQDILIEYNNNKAINSKIESICKDYVNVKKNVIQYKNELDTRQNSTLQKIIQLFAFSIAGRFSLWVILFLLSGFVMILLLGAAKELIYDKLLGQGQAEWNDMKANIIGAFDGLWRINKRF